MALLTLLDIVQQASNELGLPAPTSVVGNVNDAQSQQMLALVNSAGRELQLAHEWGDLNFLETFSTVVGQANYAVPAGWSRMVSDTGWDQTTLRKLWGPATPQGDEFRKQSNIINAGVVKIFRQIGKTYVQFWPVPTSIETMSYEYQSTYWAIDGTTSMPKECFTLDTDTSIFVPNLLVKDLKWRFISAKGLDATMLQGEWRTLLDQLIAADIGGSTLTMAPVEEGHEFEVTAGAEPNFILSEGGDYLEWD